MTDLHARLMSRLDVDPGGCWLWKGCTTAKGYGLIQAGKLRPVHRVSYELHVGPIPQGLDLDHLCRVRNCANPAHLEPVTHRVNVLRGESPSAINARSEACKHGHRWAPETTYITRKGSRDCRPCKLKRNLAYKARRRLRDKGVAANA